MNKQLLITAGVGVVGVGAGFGIGYLVFKKHFKQIADTEIESVKEAYRKNGVPKPELTDLKPKYNVTPVDPVIAAVAERIIETQGYADEESETDSDAFRRAHGRVPTTEELIQMGDGIEAGDPARGTEDHDDVNIQEGNIFDNPQPDPEDIGDESWVDAPRSFDRPYVIDAAEWMLNETNYDQITLTYWADDDVLADDASHIIFDVDTVVGAANLHRWGFKSEDKDIVYVRNEKMTTDYEITRDDRNFSEVVHGVTSGEGNGRRVGRMRSNDE